jgi:hypothetical protein
LQSIPTFLDLPIADPKKQLELAVKAVFNSLDSPRANKYRSINQITGLIGTAVNIQSMVFGNMGNTSGTGVLFTRNPSTGEKKLYGEFLINAQVIYDLITSCYFIFVNHAIISYLLVVNKLLIIFGIYVSSKLFIIGRGCSCWDQDT